MPGEKVRHAVKLFYFDGCPSWQTGLENLNTVLQAERLENPVTLVKVREDSDAARLKFLGLPSFRLGGVNL